MMNKPTAADNIRQNFSKLYREQLKKSEEGGDISVGNQSGQEYDQVNKSDDNFDKEKREKLAEEGKALPDGSLPTPIKEDLKDAIKLRGHEKDTYSEEKIKNYLIKRAKDLNATDLLPEEWQEDTKKAQEPSVGQAKDDEEYKKLVRKLLKKYGVDEIKDLTDKQKKNFFSELDEAHTSEKEKDTKKSDKVEKALEILGIEDKKEN